MLTIYAVVSIQDGSIALSSSVGMMSSSQDLFFIDIFSFWTSSIVRGEKHFNGGMTLLNQSLIFCTSSMKKSAKSSTFFLI